MSGCSHGVQRQEFTTVDPGRACDALGRAYGARLRLLQATSDAAMRHIRYDAGAFSVNEITLPGRLTYHCEPAEAIFIAEVKAGHLGLTCGGRDARLAVNQPILGAQRRGTYVFHTDDVRIRQLTINGKLISRVATEERGAPVRFHGLQPRSRTLGTLWRETASFVAEVVKSPSARQPLVLDGAARTLAMAVVNCFPNTVGGECTRMGAADTSPALLRGAVAFVEENIDRDIGVGDIAQAVHVSARAVQLMFRRHLATTPMEYVRRLRLEHAHRDLVMSDETTASVGEIAARWGFAHAGRFAATYRRTYGRAPHSTLRGG